MFATNQRNSVDVIKNQQKNINPSCKISESKKPFKDFLKFYSNAISSKKFKTADSISMSPLITVNTQSSSCHDKDNICKVIASDIIASSIEIIKSEPNNTTDDQVYIPEIKWQLDSKIEVKSELKLEMLESISNNNKLTYSEFQQTYGARMNLQSNNKCDFMQDLSNAFKLDLISRKEAIKLLANDKAAQKKISKALQRNEAKQRYLKRNRPRVNYAEIQDTDYIDCLECGHEYANGECPVHGGLNIIQDALIPKKQLGKKCTNLALFTTPDMLKIAPSRIKEAGTGVFSAKAIKKGDVFGPYKGDIIYSEEEAYRSGYAWEIFIDGCLHHYIDGKSLKTSNWMRFVNCASTKEQQSLEAIQINENIFYRAVKDVKENQELLVFYGCDYVQEMGPVKKPKMLQFDDTNMKIYQRPEKQFESNFLNKKSSDSSNLSNPISYTYNRQFKCNVCNYICKTSGRLASHEKTHTMDKIFVCEVCNYRTSKSIDLIRHLNTHTLEKSYACKVCNFKCSQSSSLITHTRTHNGEKPYACKVCNYKCSRSNDLIRHMKTHTGEKPYACKVCNYKCSQSGYLIRHMRTHTGEKPYACNVCSFKCSDSSSMSRHTRKHSN